MQIEDTPESFTMVMKAGGILDVREKYLWTGERAMFGRRDKKRGKAVGYVVRDPRRGPCIMCAPFQSLALPICHPSVATALREAGSFMIRGIHDPWQHAFSTADRVY